MTYSEDSQTSKRVATSAIETTEKHQRRRNIVSSDSEDGKDDDFHFSGNTSSESKKTKRSEGKQSISSSKLSSTSSRPIIKVKSSSAEESRPNISIKVSFSSSSDHENKTQLPVSKPVPSIKSPSQESIPHVTFPHPHPTYSSSINSELVFAVSSSQSTADRTPSPFTSAPSPATTLSSHDLSSLLQEAVSTYHCSISRKPSSQPVDKEISAELLSIVQTLVRNPQFELFRDPVPVDCVEYHQVITNPICLTDIYNKVKGNRYKTIQSFRSDLFLVISNCVYYNMLMSPEQSVNRRQAYLLHQVVVTLLQKLVEEPYTSEQLVALATTFHTLIEKVYGMYLDDIQPIRYFVVDHKQLADYDRYIKKPIQLRTMIVGDDY